MGRESSNNSLPEPVWDLLEDYDIQATDENIKISCGATHTVVLAKYNNTFFMYGWGKDNGAYRTGLKKGDTQFYIMQCDENFRVIDFDLGGWNTYFILQ